MKTAVLVFCWAIYVACAIIIQQHVHGVDALMPGLLIALQSKKRSLVLFLFILFCLIHEGSGSLRFGSSMLWYGGVIVIYFVASRIVLETSVASILLFSVLSAGYMGGVQLFAQAIQDYRVDLQAIITQCIAQAVLVPVLWFLAAPLRRRMVAHGAD